MKIEVIKLEMSPMVENIHAFMSLIMMMIIIAIISTDEKCDFELFWEMFK
jgi:hypothetical protein